MTKKLSITECKNEGEKRGGILLSKEYKNASSPLLWRCGECNTEFKMNINNVKNGRWCRKCSYVKRGINSRKNIDEIRKLAITKGGLLLSDKPLGVHQHHKWRCDKGHEWSASVASVKNSWCPTCSQKIQPNIKLTLNDIEKMIKKYNGKILTCEYKNAHTRYLWECEKKHQWYATTNNIQQGHWCPTCASYRSERLSRKIIKKLTGKQFPKKRPKFLNGLELDGYCVDLSLAFEYNGKQHYEYTPFFHKSEQDFKNQQERDQIKYRLCKQNNIKLIIIPYQFNCYDKVKLETFIRDAIISLGIEPVE